MIGIFDSGSGGLTFLAAMKRRFPDFSYLYYADYDHCPFGERSPEEIQSLTISGVKKLFDAGAQVVILACNTASAWTLRKMQMEVFPDKKILGVTIPGAEKVIELGLKKIIVFATEQTVKSRTYHERVKILDMDIDIQEVAFSGDLVRDIEHLLPVQRCNNLEDFQTLVSLYSPDGWECTSPAWQEVVHKYFGALMATIDPSVTGIVLGCTHYSYLWKSLQIAFPEKIFIDPSEEAAIKFGEYIRRKKMLFSQLDKTGQIKFL